MSEQMTQNEATDEAALLLTRKFRRLYPAEFAAIWAKLPRGARDALTLAENRADVVRSQPEAKTWPVDEEPEEGDEE